MSIAEWVSVVKDSVIALAAIITAATAIYGLHSWRREMAGKSQYEAARLLLKLVYKLRDALDVVRNPMLLASEFPAEYREKRKRTSEEEFQGQAHVYQNRLQPVVQVLQDFDTAALEAEAIWGVEIRKRTDALRKFVFRLNFSISQYLRNQRDGELRGDPELARKIEREVWKIGDESDILTKDIQNTISEIEGFLRPILRR